MSDATHQTGRPGGSGRTAMIVTAALLATALGHGQSPSTTPSSSQATGPVTVVGRVVESDGKTPVASAVVAMNTPGAGPSQSDRVLTDAEGRFFFPNVPAGTYPLTVDKPGYLSGAFGEHRPGGKSQSLDLTQGPAPGEITLTLWRSAILTGRVIDDAGEPMVNVAVRAARLQFLAGHRQLALMTKTRTDDRGIYRFSSLTPGDYVLVVAATVTSEPATY